MFCHQCGSKVNSGDRFCGQCGVPLAASEQPFSDGAPTTGGGGKEQLLRAVEQTLAAYPQLAVTRGNKTDLEINSVLTDAHWGVGKKKVEYSACLLAKEAERKVVYWEMIKEVGAGMGTLAGFKVEKYKSDGRTLSGSVREVGYGPGGKIIDYNWDYAQTHGIVESAARANGWKFTTVLWKGKATY